MRLLYVVHALPPVENSGTPLIAAGLIRHALLRGHQVGVVVAATGQGREGGIGTTAQGLTIFEIPRPPERPWSLTAFAKAPDPFPQAESLRRFRPDLVHVVDWVNLPSGLLKALKDLRIPIIRQIWNVEDLCVFNEPIRWLPDGQPCTTLDAATCAQCTARGYNHPNPDELIPLIKAKWNAFGRHLSMIYDLLVFPTASFRDYFLSLVKITKPPIATVEHGIRIPDRLVPQSEDRLALTFLGPCTVRKGWPVVEAAFEQVATQYPGKMYLTAYGKPAASPLEKCADATLAEPFTPEQLPEILAHTQVGLVPSPFETFSRAAREFLSVGIPIIGSMAFGIPDCVVPEVNGVLLDPPSPEALAAVLQGLLTAPDRLKRWIAGAKATPIRTEEDEANEWERLYKRMLKRK